MMGDASGQIEVPVLTVSQPLGTFYVGVIDAFDLREIASADIRRIADRDLETYTGIQRPLSVARKREIRQYIESVDATFPNSIIISLRGERVQTGSNGSLRIERRQDAASIIDGQHRLAGFTDENAKGFQLIVAMFLDLDLEDQATIFATINLKQTKVSASLVYELFELHKTRSPQKTAHDIAKALNRDESSALFRRIKILGVKPRVNGEPLYEPLITQGTFVKRLVPLISNNPDADRDVLKRGESLALAGDEVPRGLIFRPFFVRDEDWAILRTMNNYFGAFRDTFREEWDNLASPLAKTIGYGALMRLLIDLFKMGSAAKNVSYEFFADRFAACRERAQREEIAFTFERFPASGAGENELYKVLAERFER